MEIYISYFLMSFFLTYLLIYMIYPKPKVILKYPSLDQEISDLYIDNNNTCYRYHKTQIKCPVDQK